MSKLVKLALLILIAVWAWRRFFAPSRLQERAVVSYGDGSSVVLDPGSPAFERLSAIARSALAQ